eukprot:GHVH01005942.1.p1 GENE.GHVH01005942.1~~GHVH01005942.1.p1  ORF type:complete len:190 (-),score=23.27 GHVH01005942.1:977-1546(-)
MTTLHSTVKEKYYRYPFDPCDISEALVSLRNVVAWLTEIRGGIDKLYEKRHVERVQWNSRVTRRSASNTLNFRCLATGKRKTWKFGPSEDEEDEVLRLVLAHEKEHHATCKTCRNSTGAENHQTNESECEDASPSDDIESIPQQLYKSQDSRIVALVANFEITKSQLQHHYDQIQKLQQQLKSIHNQLV